MEVIRLCAYGQEEMLLSCQTIWLCASCETCTTRCPNEIDIAGVMDFLRQRALARGLKPADRRVAAFHRSFLRSVRRWGRTFEVGMLGAYKVRSGDLLGDMKLGMAMLKRGKLRLWPRKIRGRRAVRAMFKKRRKEKRR
jgi:heterodisulfide reductase subunit C